MKHAASLRADRRGHKAGACAGTAGWAWTAWILVGILLFADVARAQVVEIERIAVTVSDLDRTEAFYRDGLGFKTLARRSVSPPDGNRATDFPGPAEILTMGLGAERVEFIQFARAGRSYPSGSRASDLWFQHFAIVVSNMDAAYSRLQHVGFLPISLNGPQTLPKEDGRVRAFKFRDPDGHPLELIYFPDGQGRAVWRNNRRGSIALGIDHTAVSVSQTTASLAFYVNLLGMKVVYRTVNRGAAQDRLDDVRGVRVRITGLRPRSLNGAGVELLDYRSAPWRRPARSDSRIDDLWHAHVVLRVAGLDTLIGRLRRHRVRFVSCGAIPLIEGPRAVEIADPDGHDLVLEQQ
jgi:catechol 2,3-dioxygenase-like lactoylglutathione lyase family enzyme